MAGPMPALPADTIAQFVEMSPVTLEMPNSRQNSGGTSPTTQFVYDGVNRR